MKTGIIFDMDGTLWDSAKQVADAWSTITIERLGRRVTQEDMYRTMGMPMDELAKAIFPDHEHFPDTLHLIHDKFKWMSSIGLEWFYRLLKEPKRLIKRYWLDFWFIPKIMFLRIFKKKLK